MSDRNITKDAMYDAVAPDDFESMLELDRYNNRSSAFDKIIAATHDHFWDPLDTKYIDFDEPFDMENEPLVPEEFVVALQTDYVSNHLSDPKTRTRFIKARRKANLGQARISVRTDLFRPPEGAQMRNQRDQLPFEGVVVG